MIIKIIGMVIGLMITGAGLYYFIKEKNDKESRKIYGIFIVVGGVIFIAALLFLIFNIF